MRHRHQSCAPGGSDPLWRISHVHSASTFLPGVNCGNALAITSPQVCCSVPYSSTTEVMSASLVKAARKVTDSGKLRMVSLFVTFGAGDTNAEVTLNKIKLRKSVRINFRMWVPVQIFRK